jgi:hypothetical protein
MVFTFLVFVSSGCGALLNKRRYSTTKVPQLMKDIVNFFLNMIVSKILIDKIAFQYYGGVLRLGLQRGHKKMGSQMATPFSFRRNCNIVDNLPDEIVITSPL